MTTTIDSHPAHIISMQARIEELQRHCEKLARENYSLKTRLGAR